MNIKIEKLKEGDNNLIFYTDEITGLKSDDFIILNADNLSLNIQKNGNYLHIQGSNSVEFSAVCDRCAEDYKTRQIINIDYFFHIGEMSSQNSDDIEIVCPDKNDGNLVFDEYFAESLILAQPLRYLCRDDCKGLCHKCGVNLNEKQCACSNEEHIDPRWEKLTEILKKNK
ncbi:MAG: DUF177 domain-containing protein [Candidatus Delongbacteria bacterium]|nr:DUF177 domain-containing protein [Candidatus Delongbacteria bacterium]MCG2760910.1 DUF177 domain-containing protein [Candidatus Delongbacteria bacterium]